jgi:stage III sporulation protein AG
MFDFKELKEKLYKNPKKLLLNMIIFFLLGVLLILIGDISGSLSGKSKNERQNSIEVNTSTDPGNNTVSQSQSQTQTQMQSSDSYEGKTKKELIDTLSDIDGVGKISIMINYESGEQSVPAFNEIDSNKRIEEKDNEGGLRVTTENNKNQEIVMINNGSENKPLVVKQYNPKISGVVIVAEGSENPVVKERLFFAAKTVLNLPGSKVSVMPMKKSTDK